METISIEVIDRVLDELETLSEDELGERMERFGEAQPAILAYLLEAGEEYLDEEDLDVIVYQGMTLWATVCAVDTTQAVLTELKLADKELANFHKIQQLRRDKQDDFEAVLDVLQAESDQPFLLDLAVSFFDDEEAEFAVETKFSLLAVVKTVLDGLTG